MVVLDTNLWIYYFTGQDSVKKEVIRELIISLAPLGIVIPNQIYKELAKVLTVNLNLPVMDTHIVLSELEKLTVVRPETPQDIRLAVEIRDKFRLQFFDSIIYAFCLRNGIKILISEDIPLKEIKLKGKTLKLVSPFEKN